MMQLHSSSQSLVMHVLQTEAMGIMTEAAGVSYFTGYVQLESDRIQVDFQLPSQDAVNVQLKDAAFMAALAQKARITYRVSGVSNGFIGLRSRFEYEGHVVQSDLRIEQNATVAQKDAAFLAYLATVLELNYLEIGDDSADEDVRQMRVAVLGEDANGAPEIVSYQIKCSGQAYDDGYHYEMAKDLAREDGMTPKFAFDEFDPAWRSAGQLNAASSPETVSAPLDSPAPAG